MILLTGGAGFIGSNILEELNLRGREDVLVVDHLDHPAKRRHLEACRSAGYVERDELWAWLDARSAPAFRASSRATSPSCSSVGATAFSRKRRSKSAKIAS